MDSFSYTITFQIYSEDVEHLHESDLSESEEEGENIVGEDMDKFVNIVKLDISNFTFSEIISQNQHSISMIKVSLMIQTMHR